MKWVIAKMVIERTSFVVMENYGVLAFRNFSGRLFQVSLCLCVSVSVSLGTLVLPI